MPTSTRPRLRTAPPPPADRTASRLPLLLPTALVAGVLFAVAYDDGGYGLSSRSILAIVLWSTIILGGAFGMLPRSALTRAALAVGGLLAGFALWTLASTIWAASAEGAFNEFNRVSLYLAVFLLAAAGTSRRTVGRVVDGLFVGIVAVALIALTSRLFPHLFSSRKIGVFLPNAAARLSFPVGYWNGLAILVGLAVPLSIRSTLLARHQLIRVLSVSVLPAIASVVYLTSSRGGAATAALGALVVLAAAPRRWAALGVIFAGACGSLAAVAALAQHHTLVNGPLTSSVAASQGRTSTLLILGSCALAGALLLGGERALARRFRPSPRLGWALLGTFAAAAVAGIVLAHPVRRFDAFTQPPAAEQASSPNFTTTHLLSGNGSGRWQFWTAALHEFESAPVLGRGAGSFQFWWAKHASFTYSLKNAHSLYLEVLGELGVVGFLLVTLAFGVGITTAVVRIRGSGSNERVTAAALTGVLSAFLVGAAIDWIWQLTVLSLVGVAALGLLAGPAAASTVRTAEASRPPDATRRRSRVALSVGALAVAWVLVCAQAIPLLAAQRISSSQAAARRGDLDGARKAALDAKRLEPWAASPYLQLALVAEEQQSLTPARKWIYAAIDRDSDDWSVWYVAARIERESKHPAAARRDHAKAASLNPRSPLFSGSDGS